MRLWAALCLLEPVAGGGLAACGAVEDGAALEFGDTLAQGRVLPLERGILAHERGGHAQQPLTPFPEGQDGRGREG